MIRRGFWLMTGAVVGVYGYRRVSAVGRRVSATLKPGDSTGTPGARRTHAARSAGRLAREAFRFTRDVREGMQLYKLEHDAPAGAVHDAPGGAAHATDHEAQPEDGR
jgi:hypothetical protein